MKHKPSRLSLVACRLSLVACRLSLVACCLLLVADTQLLFQVQVIKRQRQLRWRRWEMGDKKFLGNKYKHELSAEEVCQVKKKVH